MLIINTKDIIKGEIMPKISTGIQAPLINIPANGGSVINTADLNNPYVIYFYPKDDTPGCTKEAISFTENINFFNKNNITIIGISKDTVEKHDKFINKHNLDIFLGSDVNGEVCNTYGVWVQKAMYGKKYMGIERTTLLVTADGIIYKIWHKVKVNGHVEDVISSSKEMLNK